MRLEDVMDNEHFTASLPHVHMLDPGGAIVLETHTML